MFQAFLAFSTVSAMRPGIKGFRRHRRRLGATTRWKCPGGWVDQRSNSAVESVKDFTNLMQEVRKDPSRLEDYADRIRPQLREGFVHSPDFFSQYFRAPFAQAIGKGRLASPAEVEEAVSTIFPDLVEARIMGKAMDRSVMTEARRFGQKRHDRMYSMLDRSAERAYVDARRLEDKFQKKAAGVCDDGTFSLLPQSWKYNKEYPTTETGRQTGVSNTIRIAQFNILARGLSSLSSGFAHLYKPDATPALIGEAIRNDAVATARGEMDFDLSATEETAIKSLESHDDFGSNDGREKFNTLLGNLLTAFGLTPKNSMEDFSKKASRPACSGKTRGPPPIEGLSRDNFRKELYSHRT